MNVCRCCMPKIWDFPSFSAIVASFELKMTVFGAHIEVKIAHYFKSIERNEPILLKMRGQPTYGDVPFPRYVIFLHFHPFSAVLASF